MRRKDKIVILRLILGMLILILAVLGGVIGFRTVKQLRQMEKDNEMLQEAIKEQKKINQELNNQLVQQKEAAEQKEEAVPAEEPAAEDAAEEVPAGPDMLTTPAGTILTEDQIRREQLAGYFCAYPIPEDVYARINGQSYRENDAIGLDDLRYLKLLHYNFEHQIQVGELIVNAALAEDFMNIFRELFENEYEIQSMYLIDNYWTGDGDSSDTASIDKNNTSAFCFREITGGSRLSNHAYGRAIDINPQQNPYVSYRSGSPRWNHSNADAYIDRNSGLPHVITESDICYQIFTKYGFSWGGNWNTIKDYQHFEKES